MLASQLLMPGHRMEPRTVSFSSDNTAVLSASSDSLRVWNRYIILLYTLSDPFCFLCLRFVELLTWSIAVEWSEWNSGGFRKAWVFLRKTQPTVLGVLLSFGLYWVFQIFLCERAAGKLVGWLSSSAKHLLRFDSDLKVCKFITYWLLEAVNIKKSLIVTGMKKWNWIKFGVGFFAVFYGFYPLGITGVSEPWNAVSPDLHLLCMTVAYHSTRSRIILLF